MKRRTLLVSLSSLPLTACAGLLPQEQLTFTGALDPAQPPRNAAEAARLAGYRQEQLRKALRFSEFEATSNAAFAGFGYTAGARMGYAVFRDGEAMLLPDGRGRLDLEKIAPRIDSVILAGSQGRTVIGFTPRGTLMSWDPDRTSRQLVLRPQQTTFGQQRVLDAVGIDGANQLVVATEGRGIEKWSLVSGHRISSTQFREIQPRRFAKGCRTGRVVFGTNTGEVRLWTGRRSSRLLYQHSGPVLNLQILPSGSVISSAKDGTVKLGTLTGRPAVTLASFSSAVYDLIVSKSGQFALIVPTDGVPKAVDLSTREAPRLLTLGLRQARGVAIFDSFGLVFTQHISGQILGWSLQYGSQLRTVALSQRAEGMIALPSIGQILLYTNTNEVYRYNVETGKLSAPVLKSQVPIVGLKVAPDETQVMVALANNRILTFNNDLSQSAPLEVL